MRIGFDTTALYVTRAGLARYVRGLLRGFQQLGPDAPELTPLAWEVENFGYTQPLRAMKTLYRELWWGKIHAPRLLAAARADLLHSTSSLFLRRPPGVRHVVTLHDLSISRHPERFRRWQVRSWRQRLPVITQADRVLCISRFTADEAIEHLGLDPRRIDVVHNGCDWHPGEPAPREQPPAAPIPDEFLLFVGSLEPGKNLNLLHRVWSRAAEEGKRLPSLVVVGSRWEGVPREQPHPRQWIYLGWQPDESLVYLYRRARALVFPSKYEGFGLPVIEAMSLGCPVVASAVASLPEIAGDAALLGPPDATWYRDALRELLAWPNVRADLIERGRKNAANFSWRRCASETAQVYAKTLAGSA